MAQNTLPSRKISRIDLSIFFVILTLFISLFLRSDIIKLPNAKEELSDAKITLLIQNIPTETATTLQKDSVFTLNGSHFGTIYALRIATAKLYLPDETGVLKVAYSEKSNDVQCVLNTTGRSTQQGFYLNNTIHIAPGQKLLLAIENHEMEVLILNISI